MMLIDPGGDFVVCLISGDDLLIDDNKGDERECTYRVTECRLANGKYVEMYGGINQHWAAIGDDRRIRGKGLSDVSSCLQPRAHDRYSLYPSDIESTLRCTVRLYTVLYI